MSTPRLFVNETLTAHSNVTLGGDAARYVGRVLRCRPNDALVLFDGSGFEFAAVITAIDRKSLSVEVGAGAARDVESPLRIRLLQGVSRGDRMDTVMQKATELGAQRISPLLTEFSVVRLDPERAAKRRDHWQGICQSACEQCGRTVPPVVDLPQTLDAMLASATDGLALRLILQPGSRAGIAALDTAPSRIELLIGPEGGFSQHEQQQAADAGFLPISAGPRVLRTETAAIAALTLVQARWGDLA